MDYISQNYSAYLHTYEAYRISKDNFDPEAIGKNRIVSEDEESILVLTEKSQKQMVKDRIDYGNILNANAQMACTKTQEEAGKQQCENMAKIWAVFRSLCKGDTVPARDEKKLMEYNDKMYQMAKQAQMIAINEKRKRKKSEWDETEEAEKKEKLDQLNREAGEAIENIGTGSAEFALAQKGNIVEIPSDGTESASLSASPASGETMSGTNFDIAI